MLDWAMMDGYVMAALPEVERERKKLPRSYIANVIYTIAGERFSKWVDKRVEERHEKRQEEQDYIELDPEISEVYRNSNAVSGK